MTKPDPVVEAERALEAGIKAALGSYRNELSSAYRLQSATRFDRANRVLDSSEASIMAAARRYAALRALAERADACAVYDLNGFGPCDPGCRHTDCGNVRRGLGARRRALEKEVQECC